MLAGFGNTGPGFGDGVRSRSRSGNSTSTARWLHGYWAFGAFNATREATRTPALGDEVPFLSTLLAAATRPIGAHALVRNSSGRGRHSRYWALMRARV